jgi:hypothetical protein
LSVRTHENPIKQSRLLSYLFFVFVFVLFDATLHSIIHAISWISHKCKQHNKPLFLFVLANKKISFHCAIMRRKKSKTKWHLHMTITLLRKSEKLQKERHRKKFPLEFHISDVPLQFIIVLLRWENKKLNKRVQQISEIKAFGVEKIPFKITSDVND